MINSLISLFCSYCLVFGFRFRTADYKNQFDEYEYTLFDLRPMTQHLARVYAENSITEGQRNIAQYAEVTFTTGQKRKSCFTRKAF